MDEPVDVKQISKYNDGMFSISRLHDNWLRCYKHIRRGNFNAWKVELDIIWLELYPDINRNPNKDNLIKTNNKLIERIAESKTRSTLYYHLNKRQEFLRGLQDESGKGGVYIDEDEELFE